MPVEEIIRSGWWLPARHRKIQVQTGPEYVRYTLDPVLLLFILSWSLGHMLRRGPLPRQSLDV